MNNKAVCVCMCVCVLASTTRPLKDILALCLRSLWSQAAADCPTGGQEEGTQLPQTTHTHIAYTRLCTQNESQSQITQAHRHNCMHPYTVKYSHTVMPTHRGLARGQRVRRVSTDESVESEPGRRWSSATHTASISVPRSRAENKSRTNLLNLACCSACLSARKTHC